MSVSVEKLEESAIVIVQIIHQLVGITRTSWKRAITHSRISVAAIAQRGCSSKAQYRGRVCYINSGKPSVNNKKFSTIILSLVFLKICQRFLLI